MNVQHFFFFFSSHYTTPAQCSVQDVEDESEDNDTMHIWPSTKGDVTKEKTKAISEK